jgi:predicted DsbA family dithiol-disulfide isomerase
LIKLTPPKRQEEIIDAIYGSFFEHGEDVGDLETLLKIAEKMVLNPKNCGNSLIIPDSTGK